jgi:hypothetical protein
MFVRDKKICRQRHPLPNDYEEHAIRNSDDGAHQKEEATIEEKKKANVSFEEKGANIAKGIDRHCKTGERYDQEKKSRKRIDAKCHLSEQSRGEQRHDYGIP